MRHLSTWQNIAIVASPALAAVAAVVSAIGVRQTRNIARAANLPDLVVQVLRDPSTGQINATIHNAGKGAARGLLYFIAQGGECAYGSAGTGILRADEIIHVRTEISTAEEEPKVLAMALCRDRYSYPHTWTNRETHRVHKTLFRRRPNYSDLVDRAEEELGELDRDGLTNVGAQVSQPSR